MAKNTDTATETTEVTEAAVANTVDGKPRNKNISAQLSEGEHFTFNTYCKVSGLKVGEAAGAILSDWMRENLDRDELRAKVMEQLGL